MGEFLKIPPPNLNGLTVSSPDLTGDIIAGTHRLASEFAPSRVDEFSGSLRKLLEVNGNMVASNPEKFSRGGRVA